MNGRDAYSRRTLVVGAVLLVGLAGAFALVLGGSPLGSESPAVGSTPNASATAAAPPADDAPTTDSGGGGATEGGDDTRAGGDGTSGGTDDGGETTPTATPTPEPATFRLVVESVERCGSTCRDVTVTIRNVGGQPAADVAVDVSLLADGDRLWSGTESFEAVGAGEGRTRTRRVDVGFFGGAKVQANDGYVTIETTIEWEGGRETLSERRKVA